MAESIAEFFVEQFRARAPECAYAQRRGYRLEKTTYGQVLDEALAFAQDLERRDVAKGDRIVLWGENSAEWVATFFGCALRGVVVVPMDDPTPPDFVRRVSEQVGAKLIVASRRNQAFLGNLGAALVAMEELGKTSRAEQSAGARDFPRHDDTLEIVFTSGTTAEPKGVVITHGNVLANLAPLEQ